MKHDVHTMSDDRKVVRIHATVEEVRDALGDRPELADAEPGRELLLVVTAYDANYYWREGDGDAGLDVAYGEVDYGSPFRSEKGDTQRLLESWGISERL